MNSQLVESIDTKKDTTFYSTISSAINYKAEPMQNRLADFSNNFNGNFLDSLTSYIKGYAETPNFSITAGDPLRIRLSHPGGQGNGLTFSLRGHVWQEEPYIQNSYGLVAYEDDTNGVPLICAPFSLPRYS